jgi:hypothetical protein
MERFLKRHHHRLIGVIAGFDRMLFRGTILSIIHTQGMAMYLSSQRVLLKDFAGFAKGISRKIIRFAEEMARKSNRPYVYLESSATSKEDCATRIAERDRIREGLVCVLSCVEPCHSWTVVGNRNTKSLDLIKRQRKCLHLYFYYLDRDFGLMHIRLQTWFPFSIQVCLNGREWLARQMQRARLGFEKRDNCFARLDDPERAQALADRLVTRKWHRFLNALARRHNPFRHHGYYWTLREAEYATDLLFRDRRSLGEIYPALTRHAIQYFDSTRILRFLGRRTNVRFNGEAKSEFASRIEGVRVKHWVEENSIKMYDKYGSVLRIETTINNAKRFRVLRKMTHRGKTTFKWFYMRKGLADIPRRAELSQAANQRYLDALSVVGEQTPCRDIFDPVSKSIVRNARSYRSLRPVSPEDARIFAVLIKGDLTLQGFRNKDLRHRIYPSSDSDPDRKRKAAAKTTRLLRLFRAHGLVHKSPRGRYYTVSPRGQQLMSAALVVRDLNALEIAA